MNKKLFVVMAVIAVVIIGSITGSAKLFTVENTSVAILEATEIAPTPTPVLVLVETEEPTISMYDVKESRINSMDASLVMATPIFVEEEVILPLTDEELFAKFFPKENYIKTVLVLGKVLHGEARGVKSDTNKACVIWCILNRVDKNMRGDTPIECATASHQFAYSKRAKPNNELLNLVKDVMGRWLREKNGEIEVGRVLSKEYCFFIGNGKVNIFKTQYGSGGRRIKPMHSDIYGD